MNDPIRLLERGRFDSRFETKRDGYAGAASADAPMCRGGDEPAPPQPIGRQVADCIQQLGLANEELRETQRHLAAQATDLQDLLARRNAQVRERLETMDTVCYVLAHVLREPVRSISGFAELLLADNADTLSRTGREHLVRITDAAARLDRMIQDVVAFASLNQTEVPRENVSLDAAVSAVVGDLAGVIASTGAVVDVQRRLPWVRGHAARLQEVLAGLLDNALKFVAPGVTPRVRLWAEPRSARVRLWIQDNGVGVPADQRDRIFGLFQRLDHDHPGTGAGLALVRKGVEQMGGEVGVDATTEGSRFWIDLHPARDR